MGLTFASYVIQPFFHGDCVVPEIALQIIAGVTICIYTFYILNTRLV